MSATEPVHLEGNWVGWLTPDTELEEIEFGDRVCDFLTDWMLIRAYGRESDRLAAAARELSAEVAIATSRRGLPFPAEWWPPSAGEMPRELAAGAYVIARKDLIVVPDSKFGTGLDTWEF